MGLWSIGAQRKSAPSVCPTQTKLNTDERPQFGAFVEITHKIANNVERNSSVTKLARFKNTPSNITRCVCQNLQ